MPDNYGQTRFPVSTGARRLRSGRRACLTNTVRHAFLYRLAPDDIFAGGEAVSRLRRRRQPLVTLLTAVVLVISACTPDLTPVGSETRQSAGSTVAPSIPAADERAIRSTIDSVNSTAAGAVSVQQAALAAQIAPEFAGLFDACPPATTTVQFEPVYQGLRPSPGWTGEGRPLAGTVYALPTLIRIYTGDRVTGTDLATLHLGVQTGEAYLTPLCVN